MATLKAEQIAELTKSKNTGLIISYSPAHLKVLYYFLSEFRIENEDPTQTVGVFRFGDFLVVGKQPFLEQAYHRLTA